MSTEENYIAPSMIVIVWFFNHNWYFVRFLNSQIVHDFLSNTG